MVAVGQKLGSRGSPLAGFNPPQESGLALRMYHSFVDTLVQASNLYETSAEL
jgi:hypothetical protein